ncbi:threonyl-tRNA synthetase [Neurospora tetrasperma FGSC 2509]|nr:threonyl-tRNA synthetase [Neurospora tetrasperma FGSC 2509]
MCRRTREMGMFFDSPADSPGEMRLSEIEQQDGDSVNIEVSPAPARQTGAPLRCVDGKTAPSRVWRGDGRMLSPRLTRWTSRALLTRARVPLARPAISQVQVRHRLCSSCASANPVPTKPAAPDHRDLGTQQELFMTSIYSPGSPIFLPNGARIFNRLVEYLRKQYVHYGFQEVITPTIYKKALWAKSGHLENYADDMFTVTSTSPSRADVTEAGEVDEYGLKPMNCPGHCLIFAAQKRSYRDLPIRYADFSPLHRNEISGALSGLTRVRRFHQDDGHIFCRPSQIEDEISKTLEFIRRVYKDFRLGSYRLKLSTRPENHIGSLEDWEHAEGSLKRALDNSGEPWTLNEGDGAFYGPKIDVILKDSDGKEHQTATIQLDFQLPKRFELEYQAPAPELEAKGETTTDPELLAASGPVRPVMIHRAVLGSAERMFALLIEHYNGKWPFWLNPRQGIVLTVNDSEPVLQFARNTQKVLLGTDSADVHVSPSGLAVDLDDSARSLSLKIREAKTKGYGMIIVVGPKDIANGTVTVDATGGLQTGDKPAQKNLVMAPEELLQFMKTKVDAYE